MKAEVEILGFDTEQKLAALAERADKLERAIRALIAGLTTGNPRMAAAAALEVLDDEFMPRGNDGSDGDEDGHWLEEK